MTAETNPDILVLSFLLFLRDSFVCLHLAKSTFGGNKLLRNDVVAKVN